MAIFGKKRNGSDNIAALERELRDATARRDQLKAKLVEAEHGLNAAVAERRQVLVEANLDEEGRGGKEIILAAREEVEAIADAVGRLTTRSRTLRARLAVERRRAEHAAAAAELASHTRKLADAIEVLRTSAAAVIAALPGVLSRTPFTNSLLPKDLGDLLLTNVIDVNLGDVVKLANSHGEALLRGDASIRAPDVPMPPAAPAHCVSQLVAGFGVLPPQHRKYNDVEGTKSDIRPRPTASDDIALWPIATLPREFMSAMPPKAYRPEPT